MITPTEIRAEALALLIQGHSCRDVRRRLQREFPSVDIPHHSTIARWMQRLTDSETKAAIAYWSVLTQDVARILFKRLDDAAKEMPPLELLEFASRANDVYYSLRERRRRLVSS